MKFVVTPGPGWANAIRSRVPADAIQKIAASAVDRAATAGRVEATKAVREVYPIANRYLFNPRKGRSTFGIRTDRKNATATLVVNRTKLPLNKAAGFAVRELKPKRKSVSMSKKAVEQRIANFKGTRRRKKQGNERARQRMPVKTPRPTQNMGGVVVNLGTGKTLYLRQSFVARVRSDAQREQGVAGHVGVFRRSSPNRNAIRVRRFPIREHYGPALIEMFDEGPIVDRVTARMSDVLAERVRSGLTRFGFRP